MRRFLKRLKSSIKRLKPSIKRSGREKSTGKRWSLLFFLLGGLFIITWSQYKTFFNSHSQLFPDDGGIYTESLIGSSVNLSPFSLDGSLLDQDLKSLIYEGLLTFDPLSGQIQEGLGSMHISEDKKTYEITLKNNVFFQNGDPVTIDDVLFTFEQLVQNPGLKNSFLRDSFEYVSIDRVDQYSVSFTLPEQNVFFPYLLAQPILPEKSLAGILIEEITDPQLPFNQKPIGAGPFKLSSIVKNDNGSSRIFLNRNEKYHRGKPYIDQIVLYAYPDRETLEIDNQWTTLYSHIPTREIPLFMKHGFDAFAEKSISPLNNYKEVPYVLPRFTGVFFNLDKKISGNLYFRQALRWAMDKDLLLKKEEGWLRIDSPFFFSALEEWHSQDASKARQILNDANFSYSNAEETRIDEGGTGEPLQLRMITSTNPPVYSRFAQNAVQIWQDELDIDIQLDILNPIEFQDAVSNRDYDMVLFGMNHSHNYEGLSTWHSTQTNQFNLANLTNQNVDFLISEVRFSGAKTDLAALSAKIDQLAPVITLGTPEYKFIYDQTQLKGFESNLGKIWSHSQRYANIHEWYFKQKEDWNFPDNKSKTWAFIKWIFGNKNPIESGDVKARLEP